jgi:hypothetical protein
MKKRWTGSKATDINKGQIQGDAHSGLSVKVRVAEPRDKRFRSHVL